MATLNELDVSVGWFSLIKKTKFTRGNNFIVAYLKRRNRNSSFLHSLNFAKTMTSYLKQCGFLVIEL